MIRAAHKYFFLLIIFQSFSKLQVLKRSYCFSRKLSSIQISKVKIELEFLLHVSHSNEKKTNFNHVSKKRVIQAIRILLFFVKAVEPDYLQEIQIHPS